MSHLSVPTNSEAHSGWMCDFKDVRNKHYVAASIIKDLFDNIEAIDFIKETPFYKQL